jgi:hypothetical protein
MKSTMRMTVGAQVLIGDAVEYLRTTTERFDVIICDFPDAFPASREVLQLYSQVLAPLGERPRRPKPPAGAPECWSTVPVATRAFIQSFSGAAGSRSTHRSLFVPSLIRAAGTHIRAFLSGAHVLHPWLAAFSPFVIPWRCCVQSFYASVAKALTPSGVVSVQVSGRRAP